MIKTVIIGIGSAAFFLSVGAVPTSAATSNAPRLELAQYSNDYVAPHHEEYHPPHHDTYHAPPATYHEAPPYHPPHHDEYHSGY